MTAVFNVTMFQNVVNVQMNEEMAHQLIGLLQMRNLPPAVIALKGKLKSVIYPVNEERELDRAESMVA
jgi:hypothetical protein